MTENLMSFIDEGPYIHSDASHFKRDVKSRLENKKLKEAEVAISAGISRLETMSRYLKEAAQTFLADWGGDYKKASFELFAGTSEKDKTGAFKKNYVGTLNRIINSYDFINMV
jgi:hypothetical protein